MLAEQVISTNNNACLPPHPFMTYRGKWDHIITDRLQRRKDTGNWRVLLSLSRGDGRQSGELELPRHRQTVQRPKGRQSRALQLSPVVFKLLLTLSC